MKKIIHSKTIPVLVMIASFLAAALRLWTRGAGPDAEGLFEPKPFAWVLLWLLTAGVAAMILYAVRGLKNPGAYQDNYPCSMAAAFCAVPAALCFLVSGLGQVRSAVAPTQPMMDIVGLIAGILGLAAGVCLLLSSASRAVVGKPVFLLNGVVCLYLALRLFNQCRGWSNEPQMGIVVFPFLASLALMLSAYDRTCFDVDMGNRRRSLLWSLLSVYLCVVAVFSFREPLFYGACALWQISDLCSLRPLKRKPRQSAPEEETPESET